MRLLEEVAGLHEVPAGAYNIRANGQMAARAASANIDIISKEDGTGIDIRIKPGTKKESVHIPVVLSQSAGFTTAATGIPDMTASTGFLWERTPR